MNGITLIATNISDEGKAKLEKYWKDREKRLKKMVKYFRLLKKMNDENKYNDFIYTEDDKYYLVSWESGKWSDPKEIAFLE